MLEIYVLSDCSREGPSGGDKADRTSQAELECEIEGSATIGRVSQKLTPIAVRSTRRSPSQIKLGCKSRPI